MPGKGTGDSFERETTERVHIPIEDIDTLLGRLADWELVATVEYNRGQLVRTRWTLERKIGA